MIVFNATEEQLKLLYEKAAEASVPEGWMAYEHEDIELSDEEFEELKSETGYRATELRGRKVNLLIRNFHKAGYKLEDGQAYPDKPIQSQQTFASTYPTWQLLLEAAGITDWKEIDLPEEEEEYYFWD